MSAAASVVAGPLLHPARLTRLHLHHHDDARVPGPGEVVARALDAAWAQRTGAARTAQEAAGWVVVQHATAALVSGALPEQVAAEVEDALAAWATDGGGSPARRRAARRLRAHLADPGGVPLPPPPPVPAGAPW